MRIDAHNLRRDFLFTADVDLKAPPSVLKNNRIVSTGSTNGEPAGEIYLDWDQAVDDEGGLRRCPVCGCRELFCRKDFPQGVGFTLVVVAAAAALVLFGMRYVLAGAAVLAAMAVIDGAIYLFTGRCVVCYRCRSEFRDLPIRADHPKWDLSLGEKYRIIYDAAANSPSTPEPPR